MVARGDRNLGVTVMAAGGEDEASWREEVEDVYRRHAAFVYDHLLSLTRNETEAWDLTQEAFLRYLRYRLSGRRVDRPLGFLYRTATRLSWRAARRRRLEPLPLANPPELAESMDTRTSETRLALERLWPRLDARLRVVAKLRFIDRLNVAEVCEATGWSRGRVRRCLKKINKIAEETGLGEIFSPAGGHNQTPRVSYIMGGEDPPEKGERER